MGFRRSDFFDSPDPVDFTNPVTGAIDWASFATDLMGRLLQDHVGFVDGVTTEELAQVYFRRTDFEACTIMGQALQRARRQLITRGIFLKNTSQHWHIAADAGEKMDYLKGRTRGLLAAFRRTETQLAIAANQHPEIAEHPMVEAFEAAGERFAALERAERQALAGGSSGGSND